MSVKNSNGPIDPGSPNNLPLWFRVWFWADSLKSIWHYFLYWIDRKFPVYLETALIIPLLVDGYISFCFPYFPYLHKQVHLELHSCKGSSRELSVLIDLCSFYFLIMTWRKNIIRGGSNLRVHLHQVKTGAKAKRSKNKQRISKNKGKHQRKFSLSRS